MHMILFHSIVSQSDSTKTRAAAPSTHSRPRTTPPSAGIRHLTSPDSSRSKSRPLRITVHARYNNWLKTLDFWSLWDAPYVLLFEADSVLCPQPTLPLSAWLSGQFAYVGAPWFPRAKAGAKEPWPECHLGVPCCVGVSGLSLWDRDVVSALLRQQYVPVDERRAFARSCCIAAERPCA